jgi:hypothetical protein
VAGGPILGKRAGLSANIDRTARDVYFAGLEAKRTMALAA